MLVKRMNSNVRLNVPCPVDVSMSLCALKSPRTSATIFGDELYPHHPPHPHPSSLPPHPSSYQLPGPPPPPPSSSNSALFHPWFRTGPPHSRMSTEDEVSSHNSPGPLSAHFSPLTHTKTSSTSLCSAQGPVKIKRTRQRVDAGEPRNSYASIANFSSTRAAARAQAAAAVAALHSGREDVKRARVENIVFNMLQVSGPAATTSATAAAIAAAAAANGFTSIADHMLSNTSRGGPFSQLVSPNSKSDTADSIARHSTSPQNSSSSQMNGNVVNGSSSFASFIKGVQAQQQAQQASETSQSSSFNGNFSEASADSDMSHNNNSNSEGQIHPASPSSLGAAAVTAPNKNGKETSREERASSKNAAAATAVVADEEDEDDDVDDDDVSQVDDGENGEENSLGKKAKNTGNCINSNSNFNCNSNSSCSSSGVKKVKVPASTDLDEIEKQNQQKQQPQQQHSQLQTATENSQSQSTQPVQVNGCKKRKLYQPQQTTKVIRAASGEEDEELDEDSIPLSPEDKEETEGDEGELEEELEDEELVSDLSLGKKSASSSAAASPLKSASGQPAPTQSQVFSMRKRYVDIAPSDADADMDQRSSPASNAGSEQYFPPGERKGHSAPVRFTQHSHSHSPGSLEGLLNQLKADLLESIVKEIEKTFSELARSSGLKAAAAAAAASHDHESPKELTLLAQMLESKDHHQHHRQSSRHSNASALMAERLSAASGHKAPGESKQLPTAGAINGGGGSGSGAGLAVSVGVGANGGHHRGGQGSPFTLTTESAPAPRSVTAGTGNGHGHSNHHALASGFPSTGAGFKTPFSFLPAIAASQGASGSMMPPSLAQHFNSLASALSQRSSGGSGGGGSGNESGPATATRDTASPCSPSPNGSYAEQEALSLVLTPKRKRTKSSTPSAPPPLIPNSLPTSVAIPNPSLHSDFFSGPAFPFTDPSSRLAFFAGQHHPSLLNQSHGSNGPEHDSERECDRSPSVRETRESLLHHRSSVANGSDGTGHLTSLARESSKHQSVNNAAMAQAVTNALAAHHLSMLAAANRGSPDSLHGYNSSGLYPKIGSENGADGSEASINDSSPYDPSMPLTSTLTPMHLRKAKLMFFYVRYPSSAVLKIFFPDIKFNKNNTAQLVKWFSNFREFYYIQMEKYARQAVSEGITRAEDIEVTMDSELLRVLNLHYNRNNHIEVPEHFRFVVEQTLREFFKSIYSGKDSEQSWKKAIYKIISRHDDNVPEYFKSPTFLDQLE